MSPASRRTTSCFMGLCLLTILLSESTSSEEKGKPPAGNLIVFRLDGPGPEVDRALAAITVGDKKVRRLTPKLPSRSDPGGPTIRVSPDGKTVAYLAAETSPPGGGLVTYTPFVGPVNDPIGKGRSLEVEKVTAIIAWSPSGDQLLINTTQDADSKSQQILVDVATKKTKPLNVPKFEKPDGADYFGGHYVTDWSPDGKWFITTCAWGKNKERHAETYLVSSDGASVQRLKHIEFGFQARFSPDGKRVLYLGRHVEDGKEMDQLVVADLGGGKPVRVSQELTGRVGWFGYCWSPDGKRIAYVWENWLEREANESFLMLVDADGRNSQVLFSQKSQIRGCIHSPSWR